LKKDSASDVTQIQPSTPPKMSLGKAR